ncbi:hypothetical protein [Burkholderia guangdongensis]|uniref:hypothetical protein n=1 Tax=Burkholderia guangdongensis TaxID=1792500 RepID=UPI0015CCA360|nr:hypothetical protein [Burkholderia guangdongensis]
MNVDGGHYFLTVLSPVRVDPQRDGAGRVTSPTSSLRDVLATLPTAAQSAACIAGGRQSPFSRCDRTHFARFVVIDQPAFNGRVPVDSLVDAIRKTDLLAHQPVDNLSTAWLLWAVDFDPGAHANDADGGLHDYLVNLWNVMGAELAAVYRHCYGFEAVKNGDDFGHYIRRCQVETTMPFNDYWITSPPLPTISIPRIAAAIAVFTLGVTGLVTWKAGAWGWVALLLSLAVSVYTAYRYILGRGARPFAAAPHSNLRTVLKSLYLQQHFARFAIAQQGAAAADLHAAFGRFVDAHRPDDLAGPSQAPGVIQS